MWSEVDKKYSFFHAKNFLELTENMRLREGARMTFTDGPKSQIQSPMIPICPTQTLAFTGNFVHRRRRISVVSV